MEIFFFHFLFRFAVGKQNKEKEEKFHFSTAIFNYKASNSSPIMPPHSSLLNIHSTLVSTTDDSAKLARNASLFGAMASTPNPDLEEAQQKILLYAFSSLKDPYPSITWAPYQSPSGTPLITAFLAIAITENDKLRLRLISCPQSNGDKPCNTFSVSGLSVFTRTSDPMPPSIFTVGYIDFRKTVFYKPISHLFRT